MRKLSGASRHLLSLVAMTLACGGVDPSETPMEEVDAFIEVPPVTPPMGPSRFEVAGRRQRILNLQGCGLVPSCSLPPGQAAPEEQLAPLPGLDLAFSDQELWGVTVDLAGRGVRFFEDLRESTESQSLLGGSRVEHVAFGETFAGDPLIVAAVEKDDGSREVVVTRPGGLEGPVSFVPDPPVGSPLRASATRTIDGLTIVAFAEPTRQAIRVIQSDGVQTRIPLPSRRCTATPQLVATCGQPVLLTMYEDPEGTRCRIEAFGWFEDEADWFPTGLHTATPLMALDDEGQLALAVASDGQLVAAALNRGERVVRSRSPGEGWRGQVLNVAERSGRIFARSMGPTIRLAYAADEQIFSPEAEPTQTEPPKVLLPHTEIEDLLSFDVDACARPAFTYRPIDDERDFLVRYR